MRYDDRLSFGNKTATFFAIRRFVASSLRVHSDYRFTHRPFVILSSSSVDTSVSNNEAVASGSQCPKWQNNIGLENALEPRVRSTNKRHTQWYQYLKSGFRLWWDRQRADNRQTKFLPRSPFGFFPSHYNTIIQNHQRFELYRCTEWQIRSIFYQRNILYFDFDYWYGIRFVQQCPTVSRHCLKDPIFPHRSISLSSPEAKSFTRSSQHFQFMLNAPASWTQVFWRIE